MAHKGNLSKKYPSSSQYEEGFSNEVNNHIKIKGANPHGTTAAQVGAAEKVHEHGEATAEKGGFLSPEMLAVLLASVSRETLDEILSGYLDRGALASKYFDKEAVNSLIDGVRAIVEDVEGRVEDVEENPVIYLGSGDMPEDCNVQIDPEGEVVVIVQELGDSETNIMSQAATTREIRNSAYGTSQQIRILLQDLGAERERIDYCVIHTGDAENPHKVTAEQIGAFTKEQTEALIKSKVAELVASAPEALDTLVELSKALDDDPNFATTIMQALGEKANAGDVYTKAETKETARRSLIKEKFTSNFDLSKLTIDENGISLKTETGLPAHTNLLWLKGQNDSELLEFDVTVDETSRNGYARCFVSSREDVNNFLFFQITITPQTGTTFIGVRPFWRSNGTNTSGEIFTKTFAYVKSDNTYNFKIRIANGILYAYCENLLVGKMDIMPYFSKAKTLGCTFRSALPNDVLAYKDIRVKEANTPYMHISYDDCIYCLQDINTNAATYTSIFDNAFLASLRDWHLKYGAVFTLNVFQYTGVTGTGFNVANMTTNFKAEFAENADWLKFAVHWTIPGVKPSTELTDVEVVEGYNTLVNAIINFSSVNNLDRVIRPSYYSLAKSQQIALKNAKAMFDGCLTADLARTDDCGLTTDELSLISSVDDYMDFANDIYYCRTTTRMENFADDDARIAHLNTELADRKNNRAFIVFTHKDNGTAPSLEAVCKWAYEHGIRFDYPMYNIPKFNYAVDTSGTDIISEE